MLPYDSFRLPPVLVNGLVQAHRFAFLTVHPLYWYPHDPVPHELITRFGLTYEAITAFSRHDDEASLRVALIDEAPQYTYYALVGQQMAHMPVMADALRALLSQQGNGAASLEETIEVITRSLEILVRLSAQIAAEGDADLAEATLLVQRGEIAGLLARQQHRLRIGPLNGLHPPAPAPTEWWAFTAEERQAAGLALRLPNALVPLADTPFTQLLRQLPRLQLLPTLLLQQRFDALLDPDEDPAPADLACSPDELLTLWQGAELGLLAMYAAVTPCGTWEDWLLHGPVPAGQPEPSLRQRSLEEITRQHGELTAGLRSLAQRLRQQLAATHPDWAPAESEVQALRAAI